MPSWLNDAVFYEIYPQSFYDSNGDGIGDLQGIIEKLPYISKMGINALWLNPCFDSPFIDAGYDVRDYKKVAPRYGTNEDLVQLFEKAHEIGIHVLLDLVPGHTSISHEWFQESKKALKNEFSSRYIWTSHGFQGTDLRFVAGEAERDGAYILNFFSCQPALNYGFGEITAPWQESPSDAGPRGTIEALKDIMRFWLDLGCDGFRVDMADSLVKHDDEEKTNTQAIWREVRRMLDKDYPEAALVSEWDNAERSINAGFHMDFTLNNGGTGYSTLFRDFINHGDWISNPGREASDALRNESLIQVTEEQGTINLPSDGSDIEKPWREEIKKTDRSYFRKDGHGEIVDFLKDYEKRLSVARGRGYVSLISGNHDTPRLNFLLDDRERKLSFFFLYTMPGVPFLYYGDEIGMRYRNLQTKEGGYFRTGSRTPMQWDSSENLGFSKASSDKLYLPVEGGDAVTVASQEDDPNSMLSFVKKMISIRHENQDLQADGSFSVLHATYGDPLYIYKRGDIILAINPSGEARSYELTASEMKSLRGSVEVPVGEGSFENGVLTIGAQSAIIIY